MKLKCEKCGSESGVLPLLKSFGTKDLEYKCADCIIKESWKGVKRESWS